MVKSGRPGLLYGTPSVMLLGAAKIGGYFTSVFYYIGRLSTSVINIFTFIKPQAESEFSLSACNRTNFEIPREQKERKRERILERRQTSDGIYNIATELTLCGLYYYRIPFRIALKQTSNRFDGREIFYSLRQENSSFQSITFPDQVSSSLKSDAVNCSLVVTV